MPRHGDIDLLVFDVLGTVVDEPGGLRDALAEVAPAASVRDLDHLVELWQSHVGEQQQEIVAGRRPFADSQVLDREAAALVARWCGVSDPRAIDRLATAERRLTTWPDTLDGLDGLARHFALVGLSNASRATLMRLNARAGLRWHFVLSAEDARTYKPAPEVYRLAVDLAGVAPERVAMVAAHAWDLRGARAVGMRTAYVERPVGDPPAPTDSFDYHASGLRELLTVLVGHADR